MFTLTIKTENAAFEVPGEEVARILRELALMLKEGVRNGDGPLFDFNGNNVGSWSLA